MAKLKYALISVFDKSGVDKFAKELRKLGIKVISSGGTAKFLKEKGIDVIPVERLTKYPSMLGGRVKTLHPLIHGGILARRDVEDDIKTMKKYNIPQIDLVIVNLYPFESVASKPNATHEEIIENIDIGGPAMVRSSAKNYKSVAVITNPKNYGKILKEIKNKGEISIETRQQLALEAFRHTERYDSLIVRYFSNKLGEGIFPSRIVVPMEKIQDLRYGENPHQSAAFYKDERRLTKNESTITSAKQIHGKELSFNNLLDLEASWNVVTYYEEPAIAIIKHNNPCGVAVSKLLVDAYKKALECDPVSAFGGIVASNRPIDKETAIEIAKVFTECVIAPGYDKDAVSVLKEKKNLRILLMPPIRKSKNYPEGVYDFKTVSGGFLVQEKDTAQLTMSDVKTVTKRQPSLGEMRDMFFAWGIAKHVKSNAIILAKDDHAVGIGAGQMSRIDSMHIAAIKAGKEKCKGAVLASDAFFPFNDVVEAAHKAGITAIIQPGGSIKDQDSIDLANKYNMAMVFTGRRHFRH